jgi:hypothetical protein
MKKDRFASSLFAGCIFGVLLPLFFNAIGDAAYNKYYIVSVIALGGVAAGLPQLPTCRYPTENVVHDHALTKLLFTESDFV